MIRHKIKEDLISKIKDPFNSTYAQGEFLPSVRGLSEMYQVAPLTINRLLKSLEAEGFVSALPRQGYKILVGPKDLNENGVVVYLSSKKLKNNDWDMAQNYRQYELQKASTAMQWPLVSIDVTEMNTKEVLQKITSFNTVGVVLDRVYRSVVEKLKEKNIPSICLDVWFEYFDMDEISRDEFQGARIAGDYALDNGFQSFGWVGPIQGNANGQIRFSGVNSALLAAGGYFDKEWVVESKIDADEKFIKILLKRKNRPKILFVFWKDLALKVAKVAESLGLKLGEDLTIIGWCTLEQFETEYAPVCPNLVRNCPTVVWSIGAIARACMERIKDRMINPNRVSQRILISMNLHKIT